MSATETDSLIAKGNDLKLWDNNSQISALSFLSNLLGKSMVA